MCFRVNLRCSPHFQLLKNLRGVVTWVAFVVALVTACIPLGIEGEGGCDLIRAKYCIFGPLNLH
jgi:hypothetical protein